MSSKIFYIDSSLYEEIENIYNDQGYVISSITKYKDGTSSFLEYFYDNNGLRSTKYENNSFESVTFDINDMKYIIYGNNTPDQEPYVFVYELRLDSATFFLDEIKKNCIFFDSLMPDFSYKFAKITTIS